MHDACVDQLHDACVDQLHDACVHLLHVRAACVCMCRCMVPQSHASGDNSVLLLGEQQDALEALQVGVLHTHKQYMYCT